MNQELLNNPDVKEIAEKYAKSFLGLHWEDFVKENTKPKEWEITQYMEEYNQFNGCVFDSKIKSVKRLSDGEILTVGDKTTFGEIIHFDLRGDDMYIKTTDYIGTIHISEIEKAKQSLFKTIDGKDIYEGDKILVLDYGWTVLMCDAEKLWENYKTFSTQESAEEYVLNNKAVLTVNDIRDAISDTSVVFPQYQSDIKPVSMKRIVEIAKHKL